MAIRRGGIGLSLKSGRVSVPEVAEGSGVAAGDAPVAAFA
jgi:hypothetical protein